jgi:YHS domain-containing protein
MNGIVGWGQRPSGRRPAGQELKGSARMAKDPVCGMEVDAEKAARISVYHSRTYYFCALGCKQAFDANPEKYVRPTAGMRRSAH